MSRKWSVVLMVAMLVGGLVSAAQAETLLGKNYIGGSFGVVMFGDEQVDDVFGVGYGFDGVGNINLSPNIDLNLGAGYSWADGDEEGVEVDMISIVAGSDLIYFFMPNEQVNPYIGAGFAVVNSEVEASVNGTKVSEDDTNVGFGGGAGVELGFTEQALFRVGLDYFNIDSEDSMDLLGLFGYWFTEEVLGTLQGSYDFESEDATAQVGLIVKL